MLQSGRQARAEKICRLERRLVGDETGVQGIGLTSSFQKCSKSDHFNLSLARLTRGRIMQGTQPVPGAITSLVRSLSEFVKSMRGVGWVFIHTDNELASMYVPLRRSSIGLASPPSHQYRLFSSMWRLIPNRRGISKWLRRWALEHDELKLRLDQEKGG